MNGGGEGGADCWGCIAAVTAADTGAEGQRAQRHTRSGVPGGKNEGNVWLRGGACVVEGWEWG